MRQYEAVIQAMAQLGGYAALGELYQKAFVDSYLSVMDAALFPAVGWSQVRTPTVAVPSGSAGLSAFLSGQGAFIFKEYLKLF
jgi:hypothetical protein